MAKLEFFIEPDFSSLKHCCLISQDFLICKSSTLDEKGKKEIQECFNYPISMDHILEVIIFFLHDVDKTQTKGPSVYYFIEGRPPSLKTGRGF